MRKNPKLKKILKPILIGLLAILVVALGLICIARCTGKKSLYGKVTKAYPEKEHRLVVGHGDLCFSNILYSREANLLKLIDPKGALAEEDLYTDPYYDPEKRIC